MKPLLKRSGSPKKELAMIRTREVTVNTDECWLWAGYVNEHGYGRIQNWQQKKHLPAHRAVYEALVGVVPPGLEIDHLCNVRLCINPSHMETVTHKINMQRRFGIDICKRGHKLTPDNSMWAVKNKKTGQIGRQCKFCHNKRLWKKESESRL